MNFNNLITQSPTILGSWALLVAQAIDSYGLDGDQILKEAGVDLVDIKKDNTRLLTAKMVKVWEIAVLRTQDPYIAIRVAHFFKPTAYGALGMTMAASRHVYDALKRCERYSHVISDGTIASLQENETDVAFELKSRPEFRPLTHIYGLSATLCCMFNIFREVSGNVLIVKEVHFEQCLDSTKPFEEFFSCPVFYGSDCNKIIFDKKQVFLAQPIVHCELACSLDAWIEEYLSKIKQDRLSTQVQKYLLKHIPYGELDQVRVARVASELAMSTRMLQRKLNKEGTTYTEVLNDFRKKLAIKLIVMNKTPLLEVSSLLGFTDQSNFTRAFKCWTGMPPNQYRG